MKTRELRNLIVLMVFAFSSVVSATAATLRGVVREAGSGEALPQASVRVLAAADSAVVKAVATNDAGRYSLSVKAGKYIIEASYVGFDAQYRNINVGKDDINVKAFELTESSIMLKEAVVSGIRTPMKVMEDTVEFSAESYKTQPNAVVEDLLKRLPGVEVSSDGKITANGKSVTKILVEGKEFFADDPTVASRNLPVDMVEKLQVVDRKSDLARMTGVDDGEDETVINLTVKKNMKNGWFGNVEAGYGTDNRYKGSFTVNRFINDNQLTFLGGGNNINEPAFTDGASGRFMRFGGNNGINNAQSFGINFNVGNKEIFRIGGNVLYSHSDRTTETERERQYLYQDATSQNTSKNSRDRGHNARVDLRLQWKPDSANTLEFRPNVSLNYNNSTSSERSTTYIADALGAMTQLTRSDNSAYSHGKSFEFGGRLIYNHNFSSRKGRSLSLMANYNLSNVREYSDTYSKNWVKDSETDDAYDQYANNHTWNNNVGARLTWTEPIGNLKHGNFVTVAYSFRYRWNNADKLTYDAEQPSEALQEAQAMEMAAAARADAGGDGIIIVDGKYYFLDNDLSNQFRNDYMNQDIRLGFRHVDKANNLNVGVSLVPQYTKSIDLIKEANNLSRHVFNFAPFLRYRLKLSKTRSLNAFYNGRSSQPSMSQMQPVPDVSDPLRIVIGNPDLLPSFTHNLNFRFQDFDSHAQRSIMLMLNGSYQQNAIISLTDLDRETGVQTTTYGNVNGVWNVRAMNMLSFPLRNKAFTFNNHLMLSYNSSVGYNDGNFNRAGSFRVGESFGFAWRPDDLEFEIRPNYNLQVTNNSVQKNSDRTVHTYGGTFYATYNTPIGIVLNTDLNYAATEGYAAGYDTKTWMWNASISYQFLKGRAATVTLRAYDILGQKSNISRNVTANYIDDERFNALTRYVMLSFSYKFNTFGKGKEPTVSDGAFDGPPGMPRGQRPSGPPPDGGPRF